MDPELAETIKAVDVYVIAELTDSGRGIPADPLNRLFEPFFTTKDIGSGTGLGLHISHNIIVQRHGGDIEIQSRPGQTTFRVTLPARRNQ